MVWRHIPCLPWPWNCDLISEFLQFNKHHLVLCVYIFLFCPPPPSPTPSLSLFQSLYISSLSSGLSDALWLNRRRHWSLYSIIEYKQTSSSPSSSFSYYSLSFSLFLSISLFPSGTQKKSQSELSSTPLTLPPATASPRFRVSHGDVAMEQYMTLMVMGCIQRKLRYEKI